MLRRVRHSPPWLEVHVCDYLLSYCLILFGLKYLPVWVCCTVIRLCYHTISLLGLCIDICMYICIYIRRCHVTVWFYVFGEKLLCHDARTFFCLRYGSDVLSSCIPFMVDRKWPQSRKYLLYYVEINKNNCIVKNLFIVFLLSLGGWPHHESLKQLFAVVLFLWSLFSWQYFTMSQFSTGLFYCWEFILLHVVNDLYLCLTFNTCLVYHLLGTSYKFYVGQSFGYYHRFSLARIIFI